MTKLTVNGKPVVLECEPDKPLLCALREDLGLTGPKYAGAIGHCYACTVRIPQRELGQGASTALMQLIAEEIDLVDWEFYDPQTNQQRHNVCAHTATSLRPKLRRRALATAPCRLS